MNGIFDQISSPLILSSCTLRVEPASNEIVVSVAGELDMADSDKVASVLVNAADSGKPLVRLELSGLTFADSSAIKAIVLGAQAAARHDVAFELVNPNGRVQRLLEITGLAGAITIVRDD
ncbi:MAG TPA: STAS domain-containing protein [Ilumatobacteraceae bacterium]|nr:STAS domain-containing protein [Ilumatobacteraceae bacterium]